MFDLSVIAGVAARPSLCTVGSGWGAAMRAVSGANGLAAVPVVWLFLRSGVAPAS